MATDEDLGPDFVRTETARLPFSAGESGGGGYARLLLSIAGSRPAMTGGVWRRLRARLAAMDMMNGRERTPRQPSLPVTLGRDPRVHGKGHAPHLPWIAGSILGSSPRTGPAMTGGRGSLPMGSSPAGIKSGFKSRGQAWGPQIGGERGRHKFCRLDSSAPTRHRFLPLLRPKTEPSVKTAGETDDH